VGKNGLLNFKLLSVSLSLSNPHSLGMTDSGLPKMVTVVPYEKFHPFFIIIIMLKQNCEWSQNLSLYDIAAVCLLRIDQGTYRYKKI